MIRVTVTRLDAPPEEHTFPTTSTIVVGRGEGAHLRLRTEDGASRRHCRITVEGGRVFVEDLESKTGTAICLPGGGEAPVTGKREVPSGGGIGVGSVTLMVHAPTLTPGEAEWLAGEVSPRARRWSELGEPPELLLQGSLLRRADAWRGSEQVPRPDAIAQRYIVRSVRARWSRRRQVGLMVAVVTVTAFLGSSSRALVPELVLEPPAVLSCDPESRTAIKEYLESSTQADPERRLLRVAAAYDLAVRRRCEDVGRDAEAEVRSRLDQQYSRVLGHHASEVKFLSTARSGDRWKISTSDGASVMLSDADDDRRSKTLPMEGCDRILDIALSPSGDRLAVSCTSAIIFWALDTDAPRRAGEHRTNAARSLSWSPDGRLLAYASGSTAYVGKRDDLASAASTKGHIGSIEHLLFTTDGEHLVTLGAGSVTTWALSEDGHLRREGESRGPTTLVAGQGASLVTGDQDGVLTQWSLKRGRWLPKVMPVKHGARVAALALVDGTDRLFSADDDGIILESTRSPATQVHHGASPATLSVSADGRRLLAWGGGELRVWALDTPELRLFLEMSYDATTAALDPDGRRLVTGGVDGTIRVWDVETKTVGLGSTLLGSLGSRIREMAVSRDGTRLAGIGGEGSLFMWELDASGEPRHRALLADDSTLGLGLSSSGRFLASGHGDGRVTLWDLESTRGETRSELTTPGHRAPITHVHFSPDDKWLLVADSEGVVTSRSIQAGAMTGSIQKVDLGSEVIALTASTTSVAASTSVSRDSRVHLWNLMDGTPHQTQTSSPAGLLVFSGDGKRLAAGFESGEVNVWTVDGSEPFKEVVITRGESRQMVTALVFNGDGFAYGTKDGAVLVHSTGASAPQAVDAVQSQISGLAFTSGGDLVATSWDKMLRIWRVKDGKVQSIATLTGHDQKISRLLVPEGSEVGFTASDDGTIRAWPLGHKLLMGSVCRVAGRAVDAGEFPQVFRSTSCVSP